MVITAHKINNVLRAYGEKLRQERISQLQKTVSKRSPSKIDISARTKRKETVEKIISSVMERITQYGAHERVEKTLPHELKDEVGTPSLSFKKRPMALIFKEIDENGETMNSICIENSEE